MKLDHVVYFTKKTPTTIVKEQRKLGWHTVIGGGHEKWGTYNALMYVNNAYVEWLAIENEELAHKAENPLVKLYLHDIKDHEGWGTICCSVDGIESFEQQLMEKGYQTSGVFQAERKTTEGDIRKWKMLFIEQEPSKALPYPFFIEWETSEEIRWEQLRKNGTILPSNERLEITDCLFYVKNAKETADEWARLLNDVVVENTGINLQNCRIKFIENDQQEVKERLADVSIQDFH